MKRWLPFILLFAATALCFLDRQVLSILSPRIIAEFGMTNTGYSRVVFAFVLSYTVMLACGGRLMDLLGPRKGLGLAVGFWSLASVAHAWVTGPLSMGVARFFLGVGEGPCFPGSTKAAVAWAPREHRGLAVGFANSGSALGAVIAPPLTVWAAGLLGWRGAFGATALLGFLWLVAWYRSSPRSVARQPGTSDVPPTRVSELLRRPLVWRLVVSRFFFDWVFYFYMFWIPQYLSKERGMSLEQIGAWLWIPFTAMEISNIGAGYLSDRLVRGGVPPRRARMSLMLIAALLTPASWLAGRAGTPGMAIALMALLLFAHGIWISNFMTLIGDIVAQDEIATTVGLTGTCGGLAGMLSSLIIGPVVDSFSFQPVFLATAVVYPMAWLILRSGDRDARKLAG